MICHIDPSNGIPIYEQIERQVKFAVANGSLLAGERVPSVRELATQAAVNVNTVARAYRELQQQRILDSIRGTGLTVSADAAEICHRSRLEMIRERLRSVLQEALQNQISADEIRSLVDEQWAELSQEASAVVADGSANDAG
jgi:GntR family transcriptional regulator